jgi:hypothetical protein
MSHSTRARALAVALLAGLCLLPLPGARAQQDLGPTRGIRPPVPTRADKVPFMSYIAVVLVIAAPLGVNFISSKRGHQD